MSGTSSANPRPRPVKHRRAAAAPTVSINIHPDDLDDLQREMGEFEDLRAILTFGGLYTYDDGKWGERSFLAVLQIAKEAGIVQVDAAGKPINPEAISEINFREKTGDFYTRWQKALQNHHKKDETPQQVVTRVEQRTGPSAEELERLRRLADEADRKAAEKAADEKVPAAIRGTEYDPRNLPKGDNANDARYALAVKGLFALDELKSERSTPSLENIHDKMKETVRRVNKALGTNYPIPTESDPLSDSALEALGLRVAMAGGIRGAEETVYQKAVGQTQAQLDAAAAIGLHALDRTAGITRDSEILRREIRQFEREVMGLSKVEADGVADDAMIKALEDAVRARGGLAQVSGGQAVVAAAVTSQPATIVPPKAATEGQGARR